MKGMQDTSPSCTFTGVYKKIGKGVHRVCLKVWTEASSKIQSAAIVQMDFHYIEYCLRYEVPQTFLEGSY